MSNAIDVTDTTFDAEVLGSSVPVLVDFWAEWCHPCRAISPILEQLAAGNPDSLKVVKLNVDDEPFLAQRYQVSSIPTLKVFVNGEVATTIVGAKPKPALEADLAAYLR